MGTTKGTHPPEPRVEAAVYYSDVQYPGTKTREQAIREMKSLYEDVPLSRLTERARCYALPGGTALQGVAWGYRPALFRLIIGGRSASSSGESGANMIFGNESHR
jgi:hypothetical protein